MRDDTVVTGQDSDGNKHAGVAGWSVPGYTELKALGSGGAGDVVLARHDASGTLVAIKYMRRKLLADPQWAGLFRTEAQVLAALDDPNIVRLYEYVESPSGAAIVMELVDGVSVREILAHQGGTTPEAALVVLQGSLLGLAAAHRRGVVHRDYKPENVLVDGNGDSKLTDFGIAARSGQQPVAAGSLLYAPPEQFAGTPASPAGDVYAATATFYECLTGRPPFTGDTAERVLYQHLIEPVPLDPVPEPLRPLVAAGMAKEPDDRPADATAFVTALNAIAYRAYGTDWARRGRSHLGEAALLLAALWPSGSPAAVQGSAVERVNLSRNAQESREFRHLWHVRHLWHLKHLLHLRNLRDRRGRRLGPVKAAVAISAAVAVVAAGVALATGLTRHDPSAVTLPAVTGVSPAGGTDMGGTTVTITGTGLARATSVAFGGVPGRITARSATQITAASPPSTGTTDITTTTAAITADSGTRITGTSPLGTGTVDITVTTPAGTSKPTAADHYTFIAPRPTVTGISPDSGSTAGGTTVSITGTGLADATRVRFGGVPGRITVDSNTQITVTTPPGTGTVTVTVTTPAGASTAAVGHYTYTTRPKRTQSITFTAPAPATAGGWTALSAKGGGSGNPVVFSVDPASDPGVCTVSGHTVAYAAAGSCVIDANQAGNATYAAAHQVQQMITVSSQNNGGHEQTSAATTTALSSSANPSVAGQQVTFTATVRVNPPGAGTPTGTVTFSDGGTTIPGCSAQSVTSTGMATCTVTNSSTGSHSITASYGGDGNFTGSTSAALTQTVSQAATTTTLSSSANPSVFGQPVAFTATVRVNPPGAGTPTGPVMFSVLFPDGIHRVTETVRLDGSGTATPPIPILLDALGTYKITASYGGDKYFTGTTPATLIQTVSQAATTTTLSSSANPSVAGQQVTFTATVRVNPPGAGTPGGGTVAFSDGGTTIPGCSAQPVTSPVNGIGTATCMVTYTSTGSHSITASYGGDKYFTGSTSAALTQTVSQAATTTALSSSPNPAVAGQQITFTATVSVNPPGSGTPTGVVTFYMSSDGDLYSIGTAKLDSSGTATLTTPTTLDDIGTYTIIAKYGGDGNFTSSTSAAVTQTVSQAGITPD